MSLERQAFDVVVVGCGIAGLSAAVAAQQSGASVALLERAPIEERGGNTRYTESYWRMKSEDEVSEDFEDRFAKNAGGYIDPEFTKDWVKPYSEWPGILRAQNTTDPELISILAQEAPLALKWLTTFGVKFDFLPNYFISQSTTRIAPIGGGLALIDALVTYAEKFPEQIKFFYEMTAKDLIISSKGSIEGVRVITKSSECVEFIGKKIILASGGFEGNPEMLSRYLGPQSQYIRPVARGGYFNRGEGIRMALEAGAAPAGDYGSFHAQPVDPRCGESEPVVLHYSFGILVNKNGVRFTDEGINFIDASYEATTREILEQPEGISFAIFDSQIDDVPNWQKAVRTTVPPIKADTISDLSTSIGLPNNELRQTLEDYNKACGLEAKFDPMSLDGMSTNGLTPRKSNWARKIEKGPFLAWPIIAANCFTFGGLKINARAQVLNMDGGIIPGLYAAGEVAGIYHRGYTGSTSVMRGAVTGRLAGLDSRGG